MKLRLSKTLGILALGLCSLSTLAQAATVKDAYGNNFTFNGNAKRIVVLEFSFADALANLDLAPVGVADDNKPERLIEPVRAKMPNVVSVGTRAQPSLEKIAQLKPDLIIADLARHGSNLSQLNQIAPTLVLNSLYESYEEDLQNAEKIAKVTGKEAQFKTVLKKHKTFMDDVAKKVQKQSKGTLAIFATSREKDFGVYTSDAYAGSLLKRLGYKTLPNIKNIDKGRYDISLEELVAIRPQVMYIAHYVDNSISSNWEATNPLYKVIPAVKNSRVFSVDPNLWARARGIYASELMAKEVLKSVNNK